MHEILLTYGNFHHTHQLKMKNSKQSQLLITVALTTLIAGTSVVAQAQPSKDSCAKLRSLKAPQPTFIEAYEVDLKRLLVVAKNKKTVETLAAKETAESGNYYFVMSDLESPSSVNVFTDKTYSLKMSVKSLEHRPLSAKWVNSKILFIEVSINPHRSAYWLFDVEKEQVISTEFEDDGEIEWYQCQRQSPKE